MSTANLRRTLAGTLAAASYDFDGGGANAAVNFQDDEVDGEILADAVRRWLAWAPTVEGSPV